MVDVYGKLVGKYMGVSTNMGTPKWMVMMENPIKIHDFPGFEWVFIPWGSWLTETENGFMEAINTIRFVSVIVHPNHPMTFGEPGSLGFRTEFLGVGLSPSNVS